MFKNTINFYIKQLLFQKDEEIRLNSLLIHDIFIKYCNNEVNKEFLLDEHSYRNSLFIDWCKIYNYQN